MSLLTDLEIRTIAGQDPSTASLEILVDTATELTLKAVAEWWNKSCEVHLEGYSPRRIDCRVCVYDGLLKMSKGKMPGEE